jgi:long-chain acyl-CoA synthetase
VERFLVDLNASVSQVFDDVLADEPDRVALISRNTVFTYEELDARADAAAAVLAELGVRPKDRIAVSLPNDGDIVVAFHGAMRLGAIWVGINQILAPPEKLSLLDAADTALFIVDPRTGEEMLPRLDASRVRSVVVDPSDPDAEWGRLVTEMLGAVRPPTPDPLEPAAIAYTSGTTGQPRGVVHSQHNLLLPGAAIASSRGYDSGLRKGDFLPLTILNLLALTTLLAAQAGGRIVLMDKHDPAGVVDWIRRESVTVWNGVPALLHSMVNDMSIDPADLRSLSEVWTGGASCPESLRNAFMERFGIPLVSTYGLTEAPTVVTMDPVGRDHAEGASGKPLPHLDVRIVDEAGDEVPTGSVGEITVRSVIDGEWGNLYTPMLGYWGEPSSRPDGPAEDGVLRTGDLGSVDQDRRLFVTDRKKLLIIRGGANIYPAEVERVLSDAPGVQACVVLGVPDLRLGQRVVAVVEEAPGQTVDTTALGEICAANLAKYKVPEQFVVVPKLPRNAMGKVKGGELVELFEP